MKLNNSKSPHLLINDTELLFKMAFNQPFYFMAILSPEGNILDVNDLALTSKGVKKEDYIGKLFWKSPAWSNFPEWESRWMKRLAKASSQQKAVITEDYYQIADGSIYYTDVSTTAIYTPNNQLSGYMIQAIDTTKHRQKYRQIEETTKKDDTDLELVLEQSKVGNWSLNLVNQSSQRSLTHDQIFGYDSLVPHWTADTFLQHVIPEEQIEVTNKLQQAIANKMNWKIECRIIRTDGEIRWILASGGHVIDAPGQAKLMVGIVQDITDLKKAEHANLQHSAELQSIFNALPDTYFRIQSDGKILDYRTQNKSELFKVPEQFIGKRMQDILPKDTGALFQSKIDETTQVDKVVTFNYQLITNKQVAHLEARLNRIHLNDQLVCVVRNVTDQYESRESLEVSEQLFRTIFEQASVGVALVSFDIKKVIRINQQFCDMVGYSKEEMSDPNIFEKITHPDDLKSSLHKRNKVISGQEQSTTMDKRYMHKDGHIVWVEQTISLTRKVGGLAKTILVVAQDISQRKKAEERLLLSSKVFSDTNEGIVITDAQQLIVDVNPAFVRITGFSKQEVMGKLPSFLRSGKQSPQFYEEMWSSIKAHGHWQGEVWNRTKQGELYAELLNISSLINQQNRVTHYIGVFSDITSIKQQQEKLNLMAHYDVLTKLPNRALFIDRFHQSIAHSIRTGHQLAVCFLDLDNFKPVNDTYGHEAGDHLLIEVSERIIGCIREEDTVSRQGGDEFAILLNDIKSPSQYEATVKRIHKALAIPYIIDDIEHHLTVSSGVTLYPSDNADIDTLLRHADHAMYQSKLAGKNRSQLYSPDSDQRIIQQNLQLEEINRALINNEFQLYYQPKVNMATGEVFGAEALIRWLHPERGMIPPLDFLPFIDGTSLEIKIGEWVINEALQQLENWKLQGIELEVSINIASYHLLSSSFFIVLEQCLAEHPAIKPQCLQLEILESSTLGDLKTITHIIKECQMLLGVSFALDDFGTGYSSLTHLRSLPAETIKIDQSFVRDMLDDPSDYSIIDGVISLTKSFNRNVIAEGVETNEHGLMLLLMGCQQAQGYGIAKPMSAAALSKWLSDYIPNQTWITCSKKEHNNKQKNLKIFKLITTQWKDKLRKQILLPPNNKIVWPILDNQLCHCGNWTFLRKQEQLFTEEEMQQLENAHDKIHKIAYSLQLKYQAGELESARADLAELDLAFIEMNNTIGL